jgi:hypothetical protein
MKYPINFKTSLQIPDPLPLLCKLVVLDTSLDALPWIERQIKRMICEDGIDIVFHLGLREPHHVQRLILKGDDFRNIESADKVVHGHRQHPRDENPRNCAFAKTCLDDYVNDTEKGIAGRHFGIQKSRLPVRSCFENLSYSSIITITGGKLWDLHISIVWFKRNTEETFSENSSFSAGEKQFSQKRLSADLKTSSKLR